MFKVIQFAFFLPKLEFYFTFRRTLQCIRDDLSRFNVSCLKFIYFFRIFKMHANIDERVGSEESEPNVVVFCDWVCIEAAAV